MRLTRQEIEESTGCDNVAELVELNMASRYIDDLGYIAKLTKLQDVNFAFNDLRALGDGLQRCKGLRALNVMHNQLHNLNGVQGLAALRCLRAANNRIKGLEAIAGLENLQELWLLSLIHI